MQIDQLGQNRWMQMSHGEIEQLGQDMAMVFPVQAEFPGGPFQRTPTDVLPDTFQHAEVSGLATTNIGQTAIHPLLSRN